MTGPAARPIASSRAPGSASSGVGSLAVSGAKVAPSGSPTPTRFPSHIPVSRISSRQLDQIASQLSDEGRAVLLLLSEVRLATGHQLARRLWASTGPRDVRARAARRTCKRLEDLRVLDRLPRRHGGVRGGSSTIVYAVGPAGRRLLSRTGFTAKRMRAPGERYVAHHLAATELVVRLHEADLGGELDVIQLQTEPRCWRPFVGLFGAREILKPDLFVRVGAGALEDRYFVEIDRATESVPTVAKKASVYVAHYREGSEQQRNDVYPRVIWTVPSAKRAEQIAEALSGLPRGTERLFAIWPYEEFIGRLGAEAAA